MCVCVGFSLFRYKSFVHSKDLLAVSTEDLDSVLGRRKKRREREGGRKSKMNNYIEEDKMSKRNVEGLMEGG